MTKRYHLKIAVLLCLGILLTIIPYCDSHHDLWDFLTPGDGYSSPDEISPGNLKLWLKADAGITIATGVSNWTDQSGNGNDASQSTAANQPTWVDNVINGQPAVSFSSHLLSTPAITIGTFTIFCVFQSSATGSRIIYEHSADLNTSPNVGFYLWNTIGFTILVGDWPGAIYSAKDLSTNWAADNIAKITTHRFDGTHANHTLHIDGTLQSLTDVGTPSDPVTTTITDNFYIGNRSTLTNPFGGYIAEIIVYDTVLSDADQISLECYLGNKYGITVEGPCL